jgi:hypothetical protein
MNGEAMVLPLVMHGSVFADVVVPQTGVAEKSTQCAQYVMHGNAARGGMPQLCTGNASKCT